MQVVFTEYFACCKINPRAQSLCATRSYFRRKTTADTLLPSPFFPAAFRRGTLARKPCEILRKQSNCTSKTCEPRANLFLWRTREPLLRSIRLYDDQASYRPLGPGTHSNPS